MLLLTGQQISRPVSGCGPGGQYQRGPVLADFLAPSLALGRLEIQPDQVIASGT